jgi:hypothetical protein
MASERVVVPRNLNEDLVVVKSEECEVVQVLISTHSTENIIRVAHFET